MKKLLVSMTAGLAMLATSAQATTIDFVAAAAGNERGIENGVTTNIGGVNLLFFASDFNSTTGEAFAYLDDVSSGPGGLGICTTLNASSQCNPSSDDNLTEGESIDIIFEDNNFNLSGLSFNSSDHVSLDGDTRGTLLVNFIEYTFADAVALTFFDVSSISFDFGDTEYYIASFDVFPTPLPAAGLFMLTGLAGMSVARKRKSA